MIFKGLNDKQKEAVLHTEGPLLLLAGAGSGKTTVVTRRIAYLVKEKSVHPGNILAVTFTNKAAKEMKERVASIVGNEAADQMIVSTFHSLCIRILRLDIERIGFKKNFSIYGSSDQQRLIKDIMNDINPDHGLNPDRILWLIGEAKNALITPEKFNRGMRGDLTKDMAYRVYPEYQRYLKSYNALDFDDIIMLTIKLLDTYPDLMEKYQKRFKYVMVDEYQDTNVAQLELIRRLAGGYKNICVVGDDDQSIYGWRGAVPGNILDFEKHFQGSSCIKLEQNYRSTKTILDAANAVIANNKKRKDKALWSAGVSGEKIEHMMCQDGEDEARAVAEKIITNVNSGQQYREQAVLVRTNAQTLLFEQELRFHNIPYVLIGGQQFFDRKEVKDAVAYLKFIVNPRDEVNLLRILNYPKRSIGRTSIETIISRSVEKQCSVWEILKGASEIEVLPANVRASIERFVDTINEFRSKFREGKDLSDVLEALLAKIGFEEELRKASESDERITRRIENIGELINSLAAYEVRANKPSLPDFLEKIALLGQDEPGNDSKEKKLASDSVVLMSLHASKGLEFRNVFLPGVEEDILPHKKSVSETMDVDEERRLCYVAITRAKEKLTILTAEERRKYGKNERRHPSRFIAEIPEKLIDKRQHGISAGLRSENNDKAAEAFFNQFKK